MEFPKVPRTHARAHPAHAHLPARPSWHALHHQHQKHATACRSPQVQLKRRMEMSKRLDHAYDHREKAAKRKEKVVQLIEAEAVNPHDIRVMSRAEVELVAEAKKAKAQPTVKRVGPVRVRDVEVPRKKGCAIL